MFNLFATSSSFFLFNLFVLLFNSFASSFNFFSVLSSFFLLVILHLLNHLTSCITGFLHQCIEILQQITEKNSFYLVCIQSQPCCCIAVHAIWKVFFVKTHLNTFFSCFKFTMHKFSFSSYRLCGHPFKQLRLNVIPDVSIVTTHSGISETLNGII